jgi:dTDP-4-amino-4,6-dideoxygalactose transaminase
MESSDVKVPFLDLKAGYTELAEELDSAYHRFMESGWYVLGEEADAFEREYAEFVGTKHCVGVSNGLEALRIALEAAGIGPGDEVIVPSNTYIATWLAVTQAGATPIPVEPLPETFNLDPTKLEAAVTSRTSAVLPVHLYGQTADMDPICQVAEKHGLFVLSDCAQAHGATYHGRVAGSLAQAGATSFYPGKNLGAFGEAGAVTTDDDALADRIRVLRNYGSKKKYQNEVRGWNSRIDGLQCAFLREKLAHLQDWTLRRARIAAYYAQHLSDISFLTLPTTPEAMNHAWHLYVVRCEQRDRLQQHLADADVGTLIHYPIPPHASDAYAEYNDTSLPIAERLAQSVLSLPISPHLPLESAAYVVRIIRQFKLDPAP